MHMHKVASFVACLAAIGSAAIGQTTVFKKPFRLKIESGAYVDTGDGSGYAGPTLVDVDGDGERDLVVGQFTQGLFRVYRNKGTDEKPLYAAHRFLQAENGRASVPMG